MLHVNRFINADRITQHGISLFNRLLLVLFLVLGLSSNLSSQRLEVRFEHISLEQGLSQSSIFCILQDSRGFMWFGTEDGLNKYDGYNFEVYKNNPENLNSMSNNYVLAIYEDRSGTLWIGTYGGGLNQFDRDKDQFVRYQNDPNNSTSLSNDFIRSIYEDKFGVLWIGTDGGGLNKLVSSAKEGSTPTFIHYLNDPNNPHSLSNDRVRAIHEDRSGVLWIGTEDGLNKLDREKDQFIHYINDPNDPNSLSHNFINSIYENRSGTLWIGTLNGLNRTVPSTKEGSSPIFIHYHADTNDRNSIIKNTINSIYEDRSGTLWIGTDGGGLSRFVPNAEEESPPTFIHYQNDPNDPNSLGNNDVYSIYEDQSGVLWIGTDVGLNKFDRERKQFILIQSKLNDSNSLSHNHVYSIYQDSSGVFWIGTFGGGLNKYIPSTTEKSQPVFIHYKNDPNYSKSLSSNLVRSIVEDRSGVLWIGTYGGGLNKLVPSANEKAPPTFFHYKNNSNNPNSLSSDLVRVVFVDKSGMLWIGTDKGLNKLVPSRKKGAPSTFIRFQNNPQDPKSLSNDLIYCIYEDKSSVLWIGGNLIDGVLQYSRAGRIEGKKQEVNLNSLVKEVIESISPPKNIQVTIENELPVVWADRVMIEQVFQNLISNAVKYMDKVEGKVKIRCLDEGSHWMFHVSDNGPGIENKYYEKIFQIFQTLESCDMKESTGVGLSVVKKIVERYGGRIWVESKVGEGSTFFFTIKKEK